MEKMGSCFVCYAHEEIDRSSLDYFIETINQRIKNRVKLYFDEDLKYGEDFNGFTQHISEVDSIIVIMTPAFKRKVALRVGGVNDEFNQILERLDQSENNEGNFSFIPILFSGDNSNSIPPEFKNFKYLDLTYLRVNKKSSGEFVIPRTIRTRYFEELKKIISEIIVSTTLSSDNYQELSKTYFDDLFVDLKASYNRQVQGIHYLDLIVKTNCYQKIISQESYIAIGRKGSGKTTLSQTIPLLHPERYLFIVEIVADAFNLETLYATYSKDQFRADIRDIASRQRVFQFTWEATLIITIMTLLIENRELPYSIKNHPYMSSFESFISSLRNDTHIDVAGYYEYCFNNINGFLNACIQQAGANPEMFFTDIKSRFNVDSFLEYVFGKEVLSKFYSLMALINQYCFISLDGFDNAFDEFRKNSILYKESTENVRSRNQFEIDWLQGLFAFVIKAKTNVDNHFYKRLEFCIVAPYDRFLEVVHSERDSYRTWSRWLSMQWSGIELAILLRKRLEGLIQNYRTSKDSSPIERLGLVLNHVQFQYIPKELEFEFNGRQYTSDLFLYVLRLTLWRPRDILTFYAKILALADSLHKINENVTSWALLSVIDKTKKLIIEDEFINELKSTIINIDDIISSFRKMKVNLSFNELKRIVNSVDYKYATGDISESNLILKIRFLYEIGFIGITYESENIPIGQLHKNIFYFNEGISIFADNFLSEDDLINLKFSIHPLFWDYLKIDFTESDFLLEFTWDYLRKAENALIARM